MMKWRDEWELIQREALRHGLLPHFIAAIRKVEHGMPGQEFGVVSVAAPTYEDQLRACCANVKHHLLQFRGNPFFAYTAPNADTVLIYGPAWIDWFAGIWAAGRERNWSNNLKYHLIHLIDAEHQDCARYV